VEQAWLDELRQLLDLIDGTPIVELELEDGDLRIAIKRDTQRLRLAAPESENALDDSFSYVLAPLLGTFYRQATPGAQPFVNIGDQVEKDQVVGLIEAMKIFNEIQAEVSGRVHAILVEDGAFVEADQRLIAIDTNHSEEQPA
jgi:acetyl-CoA carboxylase biotin carboxyl carrier protein